MVEDMELYLEKVIKKTNPEKYIEILEQDREDFAKEIDDLLEKIDKAIKYIKENTDNTNFIEVPSKELLEILGDKENE